MQLHLWLSWFVNNKVPPLWAVSS